MTDLEIMLMLEEEGYEPSIENVRIFKEEYIEEGFHPIAATKTYFKKSKDVSNAKKSYSAAKHDVRAAEKRLSLVDKDERSGSDEEKDLKDKTDAYVKASGELGRAKSERNVAARQAQRNGNINDSVVYSDYELYQILEESGYKTTEKNLDILKEGLESGKYEILDETIGSALRLRKDLNSDIKNMRYNLKHNLIPQHRLADSATRTVLAGTRGKNEHEDNVKKEAIADREKARVAIETQKGDIRRAKKERNKAVRAELRKKY